jgi:hypothetical protein
MPVNTSRTTAGQTYRGRSISCERGAISICMASPLAMSCLRGCRGLGAHEAPPSAVLGNPAHTPVRTRLFAIGSRWCAVRRRLTTRMASIVRILA